MNSSIEFIDNDIWNMYQETLKSAQSKREYRFAMKDVCTYCHKPFMDINHIDAQAYFNDLRTTRLKGSDGSIIYIPNRNITIVQNLAHGGVALDINLDLDAENDVTEVSRLIKQCNQTIQPEKKTIVQGPTITGITEQTGNKFVYSIHFQVKPGKQSAVRNLYLTKYIQTLQKNGIKFASVPTPKTTQAK